MQQHVLAQVAAENVLVVPGPQRCEHFRFIQVAQIIDVAGDRHMVRGVAVFEVRQLKFTSGNAEVNNRNIIYFVLCQTHSAITERLVAQHSKSILHERSLVSLQSFIDYHYGLSIWSKNLIRYNQKSCKSLRKNVADRTRNDNLISQKWTTIVEFANALV